MPLTEQLSFLTGWFDQYVSGSPAFSAIGLAAIGVVCAALVWTLLKSCVIGIRRLFRWVSAFRNEGWQGYGLAVAPLKGPGGARASKILRAAMEKDFALFSFGAPYTILTARTPKATKTKGLRDAATSWLKREDGDLVTWGHRPSSKKHPIQIDILSREGNKPAEEAEYSRIQLPRNFSKASADVHRVAVYLIARALQPGLAQATAFKAEKIEPVADFLASVLSIRDDLPEQTGALLETDYCAMGLHINSHEHLQRIVSLRRARLAGEGTLPLEEQIACRIDLGRALLALSEHNFDPTRVREAMDHLKIAVDQLKYHPLAAEFNPLPAWGRPPPCRQFRNTRLDSSPDIADDKPRQDRRYQEAQFLS